MSTREGINPLRPYYIPPSLGLEHNNTSASAPDIGPSSSTQVFSSSARDLLPDLDYSDYLDSSSSASDWVRDALNRAVWRYMSVLTAQPFDVAKTILQAYVVPDPYEESSKGNRRRSIPRGGESSYGTTEDEEDVSFFSVSFPRAVFVIVVMFVCDGVYSFILTQIGLPLIR